ncbi:MAG: ATP-grasp domain-containing protein [Candidatus Bathycorpusculaceae bacterium]
MKRILVTGAGGPAGINFVMSLKIAPEKMFIVGTEANQFFFHLAPVDKKYLVPKASDPKYIDELNGIVEKEKVEFVHAQPDIEVARISENRETLKAKVFLPAKETIRICQDKLKSAEKWEKNNVPVAKYLELREETDVNKAFEELGTPIWIRARHGAGGRGSTLAHNKETALSWIKYWKYREMDWQFIAQEYLPGRNIGFHSLWKNGELITSMARERKEYIYPNLAPSGVTGTPAVQRTIHDKAVNDIGTRAVLAIDRKFSGIACVDLKENKEGEPCVTEINAGRMFTTSFFFSYASKIIGKNYYGNIPYLYVKLAFEEEILNIPKYDILPENIYWIRHIDAPAKLVKNGKVIGEMYS